MGKVNDNGHWQPQLQNICWFVFLAQYYVPLLRSDDNVCPAKVAQPWCPSEWAAENSELIDSLCPIPSFARAKSNQSYGGSPKESPMHVRAYAGPMSPSEVNIFLTGLNSVISIATSDVFRVL